MEYEYTNEVVETADGVDIPDDAVHVSVEPLDHIPVGMNPPVVGAVEISYLQPVSSDAGAYELTLPDEYDTCTYHNCDNGPDELWHGVNDGDSGGWIYVAVYCDTHVANHAEENTSLFKIGDLS